MNKETYVIIISISNRVIHVLDIQYSNVNYLKTYVFDIRIIVNTSNVNKPHLYSACHYQVPILLYGKKKTTRNK